MLLISHRERELIGRIGPVILRRFEDLDQSWRLAWRAARPGDPPGDLPGVTRRALTEGVDAAFPLIGDEAARLIADGVPLADVVRSVLLWEEALLQRLARDALEDIFTGAAALNRFLHHLVLACAEGYSDLVRSERDEIRRGLEDTDRLKGDLIAMISHDLKTPLTTIQACTNAMLSPGEIAPEQRERFLRMIGQNAERLSRLISSILDVSRIEARALDLDLQPQDLIGVVRRVCDGILPWVPVLVDVDPATPQVVADRDALERILVNLIDNAVRFTPGGEWVRIQADEVDDGAVEVRVADRGPGIPQERRRELFSAFHQVDRSEGGRRSGAGLGLAIVRGLAEAMGGAVGYRENDPSGAVLWVRLPAARDRAVGVAT